ncbi:tetratricopeptide repeat protein [Streptomyces sp. NPDC057539]|uniref:tetratricopeptide repeat protein n=1 Tax=Streptomyces sp. NPDC057539 TaxID=3346159 RepID=UPI00369F2EA4
MLSSVLAALGEFSEAIEEIETVIEGRERVLGPSHPWTLVAREKLATYRDSRRNA